MPAMGVLPPFLTLVAVLAMAPVAGIPPNMEEKILATPCATSSIFERWLPPIIPSATTALNNDSIAPKSAIVNAGLIRFCIVAMLRLLIEGVGILAWIAPNLLPM